MGGMSITDPEMRLFSYKMTTDSGFAPNPFGRSLTLATCKPQIRRSKKVGDWIVGFTSAELAGDPIGSERLIYLMRVGQKLHMRDYYYDPPLPGQDSRHVCRRRRGHSWRQHLPSLTT